MLQVLALSEKYLWLLIQQQLWSYLKHQVHIGNFLSGPSFIWSFVRRIQVKIHWKTLNVAAFFEEILIRQVVFKKI